MSKNFPIPIGIDLTSVRSAMRKICFERMGFIAAPWWIVQYDGSIRVRRYLCLLCKRTVSLLPEFVLPYLRYSIQIIGLFLVTRLLHRHSLGAAAAASFQTNVPYRRGQFWVRRLNQVATALCATLASLATVVPARDSLTRALQMLEAIGWIPAHRFLFAELSAHLLGWPRSFVPHGCRFELLPTI